MNKQVPKHLSMSHIKVSNPFNEVKTNQNKHLSFSDNYHHNNQHNSLDSDNNHQRPKSFHRLVMRSKTVLGKNYLKNDYSTSKNSNFTVKDVVTSFNGDHHIDHLCCKFDISYQDIVTYPGIFIVLK